MANPIQRDYLWQAFEDIQQVKASTSVDGIKLNISKELVDTLKTVNDEWALVGQARLNAVAAKEVDERKSRRILKMSELMIKHQ